MNTLKLIRIEKGFSQYELAMASGVPRYVIQLAETAIRLPSSEHQQALAEALGVDIAELRLRDLLDMGASK